MMDGPERDGIAPADFSYILQIIRGSRFPEREVYADPNDNKEGISK